MRLHLVALPVVCGLLCGLGFVSSSFDRTDAATAAASTRCDLAPRDVNKPESDELTTKVRKSTQFLPAAFVPNLGQWDGPAKFQHRQGAVTMFLADHGFVLDLREPRRLPRRPAVAGGPELLPRDLSNARERGVAVRLTFVDSAPASMVGERAYSGRESYFLGDDPTRWRTDVPRFASVLCKGFYPGVDVRVRSAEGHPEYDILLEPWADVSKVVVEVEGAEGLRLGKDGALILDTAMGPITQPAPLTWELDGRGRKHELSCRFRILGPNRFGFLVPEWGGGTELTIDPGLVWSTFVGGASVEATDAVAVSDDGTITVSGFTFSVNWPTTVGAYDRIGNGGSDTLVFQLNAGGDTLLGSTYIGGNGNEAAYAVHVDDAGVVSVLGDSMSTNYPTTKDAYESANQGNGDIFLTRIDPSKAGAAQLVYSTLIGGASKDVGLGVFANSEGVVTIAGTTESSAFPTTSNAFDRTLNGVDDIIVTRLDPRKKGKAQLVYATLVGGKGEDTARALAVSATGVVTITGNTASADYPTTRSGYSRVHSGGHDVFVLRLDPKELPAAQLTYSSFFGGAGDDGAVTMHVDGAGVVTLGGYTGSKAYPTTFGAYDQKFHGVFDAFLTRLDPRQTTPVKQLLWSTMIGGTLSEHFASIGVDADGVVTGGGACNFGDFPTTPNAHDRLWAGHNESIVCRFDPRETGTKQLVYASYCGGEKYDDVHSLAITKSGLAVTAGHTRSPKFPVTKGVYDETFNGVEDIFVAVFEMDMPFYGDVHKIDLNWGGSQKFVLNAGPKYRGMPYLVLGSATGTIPGLQLGAVNIPLNWDSYLRTTLGVVSPVFIRFRGVLDHEGREVASLNLPTFQISEVDLTLHHALIVMDQQRNVIWASQPVPVRVKN